MIPVVIADTNVVVAGLLTARVDSPVARILDGMLAAAFPFVVSVALLAEYREVLGRAALQKHHGLDEGAVESLVIALAEHAIVLSPVAADAAPDPGDQHLWELLAVRDDLRLVTGDKRLLDRNDRASHMMTAAAFVEVWWRIPPPP